MYDPIQRISGSSFAYRRCKSTADTVYPRWFLTAKAALLSPYFTSTSTARSDPLLGSYNPSALYNNSPNSMRTGLGEGGAGKSGGLMASPIA